MPGGRDMMGGRCIFITGGHGEGHAYEPLGGRERGVLGGGAWAGRGMGGEAHAGGEELAGRDMTRGGA